MSNQIAAIKSTETALLCRGGKQGKEIHLKDKKLREPACAIMRGTYWKASEGRERSISDITCSHCKGIAERRMAMGKPADPNK